ncbi:MAG: hypothetical protein N4A76_17440 [Firmicutes bacterium]|jgi:hypothetical protein|nr:hypothetical protein [Bacillota bacterium]
MTIFTLYSILKTDAVNQQTNKKNAESFYKIHLSGYMYKKTQEEASDSINRLAKRKQGILVTSMKDFINVYQQIQKINFQEGDGIKELANLKFSIDDKGNMEKLIGIVYDKLDERQKRAASFVGRVKNLDLLFGGYAEVDKKTAQLNAAIANRRKQEARVTQKNVEAHINEMIFTANKCNKITDLITKLNVLLTLSIKHISKIIKENGTDRSRYSKEDKEAIMTCINIVSAMKGIIDTPIIDNSGDIQEISEKDLRISRDLIKKLEA